MFMASPFAAALSRLEGIQRRFIAKIEATKDKTYVQRLTKVNLSIIHRRKGRGVKIFMQSISTLVSH